MILWSETRAMSRLYKTRHDQDIHIFDSCSTEFSWFNSCDVSRMICFHAIFVHSENSFSDFFFYNSLDLFFFRRNHINILLYCSPSKCPIHRCLPIRTCLVLSLNKQRANRPKKWQDSLKFDVICRIMLLWFVSDKFHFLFLFNKKYSVMYKG